MRGIIMKKLSLLLATLSLLVAPATALAAKPVSSTGSGATVQLVGSPYVSGQVGTDVSYPNCSASNPGSPFGIVGVTGGLAYGNNSCLALEASWYANKSLYVNTGLNASETSQYYVAAEAGCNGDLICAAHNYGYNAAQAAFNYATSQGVSSPNWWLDVETSNSWTSDYSQNIASLQGEYDALKANGVTNVGVYSTTYQYGQITGGWQSGWPNWGATTVRTAKDASTFCTGHAFTGGPTWLIQFKGRLDQDYAC